MTFDSTGLKAMGGKGKAFDKGKMFAYTTSDSMATVRASGYLMACHLALILNILLP